MIPGISTAKLVAGLVGVVGILVFVGFAFHWKRTMTARGQKLELICKATREAADNPKLDCGNVIVQIQQLGASLKSTEDALDRQNAKVAALGAQTAQQQKESSAALQKAVGRAQRAEATSQRLGASSRSAGPPCTPSKALTDAWRN